jgi:uncharacterized linocin/CFP29 family protein
MSVDHLGRSQAPFASEVWQAIDDATIGAARDRLTGRRFLELDGPYGVGLTTIESGPDERAATEQDQGADVVISRVEPVPMLRRRFALGIRRLAGYLENRQPLDLTAAEDAGEAIADCEEALIYRGEPRFHLPGLLTCPERQQVAGGDWSAVEPALRDVLEAVTRLDDAGFHGPYALALSPPLYNGLFRLYPGTDLPQLEHLRRLCTRGIFKAPIDGGVLVDRRVGVLIVGQDLRTGYVDQDGLEYHLYASESLALRIDAPRAICTISTTGAPAPRGRAERS